MSEQESVYTPLEMIATGRNGEISRSRKVWSEFGITITRIEMGGHHDRVGYVVAGDRRYKWEEQSFWRLAEAKSYIESVLPFHVQWGI